MKLSITYLFDPLCGWCYGASPAIQRLSQASDISLTLLPTGLFSEGNRKIDAAFASYAWSNDIRIEKLTGQHFSQDYRTNVLEKLGSAFDSTAMTLALSAVKLTQPNEVLKTLISFQKARYLEGINTSENEQIEKSLLKLGLIEAANRFASQDNELLEINTSQLAQAQNLMRSLNLQGVPALVLSNVNGSKSVDSRLLFGDFENLMSQLKSS